MQMIKLELGKLQIRKILNLQGQQGVQIENNFFFPKCKGECMQMKETIEYALLSEWIVPFDGRERSIGQM